MPCSIFPLAKGNAMVAMCQITMDSKTKMRSAPDGSRTRGSFSRLPCDDDDVSLVDLEQHAGHPAFGSTCKSIEEDMRGEEGLRCAVLPGSPPLKNLLKYIVVGTALGIIIGTTLFPLDDDGGPQNSFPPVLPADASHDTDSLWAPPSVYNRPGKGGAAGALSKGVEEIPKVLVEEEPAPAAGKAEILDVSSSSTSEEGEITKTEAEAKAEVNEEESRNSSPDKVDSIPDEEEEAADITTKDTNKNKIKFPLPDKVDPIPFVPSYRSHEAQDEIGIHPQCAHITEEQDVKNRPMLLFKYARTGSTWLAWTGDSLSLSSKKKMVWTHEVQNCGKVYTDSLVEWLIDYFTLSPEARTRMDERMEQIKANDSKNKVFSQKCASVVGQGHISSPYPSDEELGPIIATIDYTKNDDESLSKEELHSSPDLLPEQWEKLFRAVPDLAIGVLVRTNSVKRAVSALASEQQRKICGTKKLTGNEDCIKDLNDTLHLDIETELMPEIVNSDNKRHLFPEMAADVATRYGDGSMFCLSYESMEDDLHEVIKHLGYYLGAPIDRKSLKRLKEKSEGRNGVTYKRGSNDLKEYLENYDEIRDYFESTNKCLLKQLESTEPRNFPFCNVKKWLGQ